MISSKLYLQSKSSLLRKYSGRNVFASFTLCFLAFGIGNPVAAEEQVVIGFESETFARRGADSITEAEVRARIDEIPAEHQRGFLEDPNRFTEMLRTALLEKALFNDYVESPEFSSAQTQARIHLQLVRQLSALAQDRYVEDQTLEDYSARARELYLADRERYRTSNAFTFRQIALIRTRRDEGELQALADNLVSELQEGAEFKALAAEWSDDPRVDRNNGLYSNLEVDELNSTIAETLATMAEGDVQKVETDRLIFILELVEKTEGAIPEYEAIAARLEQQARQEHRERLKERYLSDLLEGELEIPEGAIAGFLDDYDVEWATPQLPSVK